MHLHFPLILLFSIQYCLLFSILTSCGFIRILCLSHISSWYFLFVFSLYFNCFTFIILLSPGILVCSWFSFVNSLSCFESFSHSVFHSLSLSLSLSASSLILFLPISSFLFRQSLGLFWILFVSHMLLFDSPYINFFILASCSFLSFLFSLNLCIFFGS